MNALAPRTRSLLSPLTSWNDIESSINRLFEGFPADIASGAFEPAVDLREDGDNYIIAADLPGMNRDDINISVVGNTVTIEGQRATEDWKQDGGFRSIERSSGSFKRAFRVPNAANASSTSNTRA